MINIISSAALVYKICKGIFLVLEKFSEKMSGESAALNMLGGVKSLSIKI